MSKAAFDVPDPNFQSRVRDSFARQSVMRSFGAVLSRVAPGEVRIEMPFRDDLTQQDGYLHAGVVTTLVDSACGYAAFSLMPADARVLTIEFKVNLLAPAVGERVVASGRVLRPGRRVTVCSGDVLAEGSGREQTVATMLCSMMVLRDSVCARESG